MAGSGPHYSHADYHHGYNYFSFGFPFFGHYGFCRYPYLRCYGFGFYSCFGLHFGHRYPYSYYLHPYRVHDVHYRTEVIYETVEHEVPQVQERLLDLGPGELSFCEGWSLLRAGKWDGAAQSFYNASLELPESGVVHMFLGFALAADGDMELAAATLAKAHELRPNLLSYSWNPVDHFGTVENYATFSNRILEAIEEAPSRPEPWIVQGMLSLLSATEGEGYADVKRAASEVVLYGHESALADAMLAEVLRREKGLHAQDPRLQPDPGVQLWFERPSCVSIGELRLRNN